ncbi:MAG: hypothetical protein ACM3JB_08480, partial [Acidobacteriaceae bacterium]
MFTFSNSKTLPVVREAEIRYDLEVLSRLWVDTETFVVVPTNVALVESWLSTSLARIPADYRTGHF